MEYLLETQGLTKTYKGKIAVDHVSMHVKRGEIYGFVGPNGAGKTTILKLLLTLTQPDSGAIRLFGQPLTPGAFEHLKRVGSIIENPYFYDRLTGRENLEMHCQYIGYHNTEEIDAVLALVSLQDVGQKAVTHYSLGMKQRLAIARAIVTRPEFLVLDEPINALDPEGIKSMRALFCRLRQERNTTILISSHILSEVELMADTIGIIQNGVLKKEISMEEVHRAHTEYLELQVDNPAKAGVLLEEALHIQDYQILSNGLLRIFDPSVAGGTVSALLVGQGICLESIHRVKNTLEDYFFGLLEGGEPL